VNERLPGISGNPLVALAEGLSLKTILAMSQAAAWCGCVTGISRPDYDAANPVPSGLKAP
jgi:hypothetical protein